MKKIILILCTISTLSSFAQVEIVTNGNVGVNQSNPQRQLHVTDENEIQVVIENNGSDGAGIRLENSNNYQWEIINESMDYWGHPNALGFYNRSGNGHISLILKPDNSIYLNGPMFFDFNGTMQMTERGFSAGTNGFDFNPNTNSEGLLLLQNKEESSGIYFDGDYCTIFSPGDQNRLLRVIDEDGMVEKFYIDAVGMPFTNSDSTRKKNIEDLDVSLAKLAELKGKKYLFKEEIQQEFEPEAFGFSKGMIPKDSSLVSIKKGEKEIKYDPSQREHFGFLAQDVERVFPNLVDTNEKGEKFVSYTEFIPLLVDGYNKQENELVMLQQRIAELEKMIEKLTVKAK